jgi:hypothetical protein
VDIFGDGIGEHYALSILHSLYEFCKKKMYIINLSANTVEIIKYRMLK